MNNYEYIIACLPVLDSADPAGLDVSAVLSEIRSQCSESDNRLIDFLLQGFDSDSLCEEFYLKALSHHNGFIRGYFAYDLDVRNTKVDYLNGALGRPAGTDIVLPERREEHLFEDLDAVNAVLNREDILERERGLDDLMWDKTDELTKLDFFNIESILGFIARLQIVHRWLKLDEQTGRELFRKLVEQIRKTYDNRKNTI